METGKTPASVADIGIPETTVESPTASIGVDGAEVAMEGLAARLITTPDAHDRRVERHARIILRRHLELGS